MHVRVINLYLDQCAYNLNGALVLFGMLLPDKDYKYQKIVKSSCDLCPWLACSIFLTNKCIPILKISYSW